MKPVNKLVQIILATFLTATYAFAGSHLVKGNRTEPMTLDPTLIEGRYANNIARDLYEPLMTEDREGNVIPGQAESFKISDDKTVYTFNIRKDAKWSNGDDVTANDFEYSFKRGVDPKVASKYSWYFKILGIKNSADIIAGKKSFDTLGVKALNAKTLQITLDKPIPYFLIGLAHTVTSPVPKKAIEKFGNKWTLPANIVSNGAYRLKEWVVNEKIVLEKSDNYYAKNDVKIDEVTFLPITQESTELNRYKAGEIDYTESLPSNQYKKLMQTIPDEVKVTGYASMYYYDINMKKKPFDDIRVRKALSYAIDRKIITEKVTGTVQIPAYTFVPDIISGYTAPIPEYQTWTQKQRDEKARTLLTAAGFTKLNPLKFDILYNTSEEHKKIALAIYSMWKKAFKGAIIVTLSNQEWKTFIQDKQSGNFQVARAGWAGDYNEASTMLDVLTVEHSANNSHYNNPKYDNLVNKARYIIDGVKRNKLYQKADLMIAEDMPIIPIYQYVKARLVKPRVGGYPKISPLDSIYTKYLYIKE